MFELISGKVPEDRDRLTILGIVGSRTDRHCVWSDDGNSLRSEYGLTSIVPDRQIKTKAMECLREL